MRNVHTARAVGNPTLYIFVHNVQRARLVIVIVGISSPPRPLPLPATHPSTDFLEIFPDFLEIFPDFLEMFPDFLDIFSDFLDIFPDFQEVSSGCVDDLQPTMFPNLNGHL